MTGVGCFGGTATDDAALDVSVGLRAGGTCGGATTMPGFLSIVGASGCAGTSGATVDAPGSDWGAGSGRLT